MLYFILFVFLPLGMRAQQLKKIKHPEQNQFLKRGGFFCHILYNANIEIFLYLQP